MRVRVASLAEDQLQSCIANSVWGSSRNTFKEWNVGDILVFFVNMEVAAAARISGTMELSDKIIWDNGLFPWRLPLEFTHTFAPSQRIPFKGEISEGFNQCYGSNYGYVFLNKKLLESDLAELVMKKIEENG